jgi:hypothetical protein
MTKLTGGCLCGAVRCEINGKPKFAVSCHCRHCQYISGGAPTHAVIMRSEDVIITKGAAREHWTLSEKGNRIARLLRAVRNAAVRKERDSSGVPTCQGR